jgi:hypothetical protein
MTVAVRQVKHRATSNAPPFVPPALPQECSGPVLADTMIEYPEQVAYCDGNSLDATVRHAVQLGVYCDFGISFNDYFFDCADEHNQFDYNFTSDRPACYETVTFSAGSTASQTQTVPRLAIVTDDYWMSPGNKSCYTFDKLDGSSDFTNQTNYTAQFQYLRDTFCFDSNPPVIQVLCHGPKIQLINTSDPSIVCSRVDDAIDGWSTIECNNTCVSDTACKDVYLNIGGNVEDGPFGEIIFQCGGNSLGDIEAAFSFLGSKNAGCPASSTQKLDTRNFHVARIGATCPAESGEHEYTFDDFFFDCDGIPISGNGDGNPGNTFSCVEGRNCNRAECKFDFNPIMIKLDLQHYLDKCLPGTIAPTLVPNTSQLFNYSARFEAAWERMVDPVGSTCSENTAPTVRMTCINGTITFVNSTYETVSCKTVSSGVMECTDNSTNSVDQFTGVVFVSEEVGLWDDHRCSSSETPGNV